MKIKFAAVLLSAVLTTGCLGGLVPAVPQVASVLNDATAVLNLIQQATSTWFRHHPDAEKQAQADHLIAQAWAAWRAANDATSGVENLSQEDYEAAFADFKKAYSELHVFLTQNNILSGNTLGAGTEMEQEIPPPRALTEQVK